MDIAIRDIRVGEVGSLSDRVVQIAAEPRFQISLVEFFKDFSYKICASNFIPNL
jgi:hypothetical protein